MREMATRPAARSDVESLSRTLGRAFFDDPLMRWMFPDDNVRRRRLPRLFAALSVHQHLAHGGAEIATSGETVGGVALWDPPGTWQQSLGQFIRAAPTMLSAMGTAVWRGQVIDNLMRRHHPEEPHWYLAVIGSDPTVRGAGFGQALLRSRLDRCDAEYAPAYLESSNPVNVPYYERFGFEVTGEISVPGGPTLMPMWRQPR